jgi:hypothetical protein
MDCSDRELCEDQAYLENDRECCELGIQDSDEPYYGHEMPGLRDLLSECLSDFGDKRRRDFIWDFLNFFIDIFD